MNDTILEIKKHYDENPQKEWDRLAKRNPHEKYITTRIMDRYITETDKILDCGGGPGHYSVYYAQRGNDVTLVDLSDGNVKFAKKKMRQYKTHFAAMQGNALDLSAFGNDSFDCVFLMGPLYHLLDKKDREKAVAEAVRVLKPNGYLFAAFISIFSGVIYELRDTDSPSITDPVWQPFFDAAKNDKSIAGSSFTQAYFATIADIEGLFAKFDNLRKETIFSQESILAPYRNILAEKSKKDRILWYDYALGFAEKREYLSHGEHIMIICKKTC